MPAHPVTLVFFHAHPDDEASQTAGTMALATGAGHRVVVVYATNGDHGEAPDDLRPGETVAARRHREASASAAALGTARIVWLGYADSGMAGWEQNSAPDAFCNADLDQAARRLAAILDEERADLLVCYDWHGGYGHPDHVQVHRVGHRAAELTDRRLRLLEVTMNRDAVRAMRDAALAAGVDSDLDPDAPMGDGNPVGTPESEINWKVDVSSVLARKRSALAAHASQRSDVGFFLSLPPEFFAAFFSAEYFIEPGSPPGMRTGWILDDAGGGPAGTDGTEGTGGPVDGTAAGAVGGAVDGAVDPGPGAAPATADRAHQGGGQ